MNSKIDKYLNQDINNPKYLFHGSPKKLDIIIPNKGIDSNNNIDNIAMLYSYFHPF
ncbi:MAG: hypothetical protein IKF19_06345 [Bacilli bacterium]|nr:hypothetical protein [Bacilli bacterium]